MSEDQKSDYLHVKRRLAIINKKKIDDRKREEYERVRDDLATIIKENIDEASDRGDFTADISISTFHPLLYKENLEKMMIYTVNNDKDLKGLKYNIVDKGNYCILQIFF